MNADRISLADLHAKRESRAVRFFLTGGTGFLGSHIAVRLLREGYRVRLLARSDNHRPAADRVREILDWFGLPAADRRGLDVAEGDITRPGLGLRPEALAEALRETDEVIHCASNTSFSERKRAEIEAVNGGGLANVLDFARRSGARFFHHVSTAFVAGRAAGTCLERLTRPPGFHNPYEETKWLGESAAESACRDAGLRLSIYRPSIVYGDSRTGRSLLFNAIYYPVRAALVLKDLFEKDIRERGGKKASEMGVRLEADGSIRLPMRIETVPQGGINVIPVDFFADAFMALLEGAPEGGIFHIVNGGAKRIEDIIDYSSRLFRLSGIRACPAAEFAASSRNPLEALYDHSIEAYRPYMRDTRIFDTSNSRPILERKGLACPELDYDVFARCMSYAVEAGWGARLFQ
jgi:nucleoside-diphosphate-sugar epimerase